MNTESKEQSNTKQIEDILDRLAGICHASVQGNKPLDPEEIDALVASLATNGWKQHNADNAPLAVQIEERAVALGGDEIANHRTELTAAAEKVAEAYHSYADLSTSSPDDGNNKRTTKDRPPRAWEK